MPHQCTNCGREFPDGSKAMLSGCPDCDGNRFEYAPRGSGFDRGESNSTAGARTEAGSSVDATDAAFERETGDEDTAQASARTDLVSPDELPSSRDRSASSEGTPADCSADSLPTDGSSERRRTVENPSDGSSEHRRTVENPSEDRPSVDALRRELDEQFEGIKIVQPGQYELNLMELYDREECIVALLEDGRYVIEVPESWRTAGGDG